MYVRQNAPFGNGGILTYRFRVNGATLIAVPIASTATDAQDLVTVANVAQGDLLDVQVAGADLVGQSPGGIAVTLRFRPT